MAIQRRSTKPGRPVLSGWPASSGHTVIPRRTIFHIIYYFTDIMFCMTIILLFDTRIVSAIMFDITHHLAP